MVGTETIAWDFDDVLAEQAEGFIVDANKVFGMTLTIGDYSEDWPSVLGVSTEEAEVYRQRFATVEVMGKLAVIESAQEALQELDPHYRNVVVTRRRESTREFSEIWLEQHFPGVFAALHLCTYFDKDGVKHTRPKPEVCLELGATHLIDDQVESCLAVAEVGLTGVVYGEYPWTPAPETLPSNVIAMPTHLQVVTYLNTRPEAGRAA